jgi:UDP-N-acetylmuramate dehydrogenase
MIFKQIDLKRNTSMQIGPIVDYVEVQNPNELFEISKFAKKNKLKIHVLGDGTNSYFANKLKKYLFLKLNFKKEIKFKKNFVTATANVNWNDFVMETVSKKLWGLENLTSIPGSVGASPIQNIGAYGVEVKDTLTSVKAFDCIKNKFVKIKNKDCKFSYRNSIFKTVKNRYIILSVTFKLSQKRKPVLSYKPLNSLDKNTATLKEISGCVKRVRTEKLPDYTIYPNSGSFFKNPKVSTATLKQLLKHYPDLVYFEEKENNKRVYKIAIAWLIEHVIKMKGVKVGNFSTYKNHSLVLVNHNGTGKAKELNRFVKLFQNKIYKVTGLKLEQEVNFIV